MNLPVTGRQRKVWEAKGGQDSRVSVVILQDKQMKQDERYLVDTYQRTDLPEERKFKTTELNI